MANVKRRKVGKPQLIPNAPRKVFVESYLTPKGEVEMAMAVTPEQMEKVNRKYRKNRYKRNPEFTHITRIIYHN